MKLSFHQHIALFWMIGAPGVFAPVIENAKRPDAGAVMAWGVAIVAVMILFTPLLLRCPLLIRSILMDNRVFRQLNPCIVRALAHGLSRFVCLFSLCVLILETGC
uniref:Hypotetical pretein n=1 Tax=Citrobacter freundii TaxID=546 RepID=A0A090LX89_CITFR|nr:Hypotetical pretein [Citrobacter freundii]